MGQAQTGAGRGRAADRRWLWLSLGPVAAFFVLLSGFPVLNLLGLSLFDVKWSEGAAQFHYLGLDNYRRLFTQETVYWAGVRNTVIFAVTVVVCQMVLGFAMALAVNRAGAAGRTVLTGIFLADATYRGALAALLLQVVLVLIGTFTPAREVPLSDGLGVSLGANPAFWLRIGVGLFFPIGVTWLAFRAAQIRGMMSATGLLYIALGAVLAGEVLARGLLFSTGHAV